jgi:hypothetical protein
LDDPVIKKLIEMLLQQYRVYIFNAGLNLEDCYLECKTFISKKDTDYTLINKDEHAYISMNLDLISNKGTTNYLMPLLSSLNLNKNEQHSIPNVIGKVTVFESSIPFYSVKNKKERVNIIFNILTREHVEQIKKQDKKRFKKIIKFYEQA